jgi:type IV pilus assembly protein PilV
MKRNLRRQHGVGLIDALVALAILSFGLLAMTRLQARALTQGTESLTRTTAMLYGDELASSALIDAANVGCYTLPAPGTCASTSARAIATSWNTRLAAALPTATATSAYDSTTGRLVVTIQWTGKESSQLRTLVATTDVR